MISLKATLKALSCPYGVGDLYITTNTTNPNTKWSWTTWTQISSDAYLKIVTSNAGELGGTASNHKIPISSIPSHTHRMTWDGAGGYNGGSGAFGTVTITPWASGHVSGATGGGNAYYPYYLGVYVWKRTA